MTRLEQFTRLTGSNWVVGRRLMPTLRVWGGSESGKVLDLGCGESPFSSFFPRAASYLRFDRRLMGRNQVVCEGQLLPVPDHSVDAVLMFQILGDFYRPRDLLEEAQRILRPGGRLYIFETMAYPEHDLPHDYWRVMPSGLGVLAGEAGFDIESLVKLGGVFNRIAILCNQGVLGPFRGWPVIRWLAAAATALVNLAAHLGDLAAPRPAFASDYLARLVKR